MKYQHLMLTIQTMITELRDTRLMTRIIGGDLIAIEAKYHLPCLVKLRNRYHGLASKRDQCPENIDEKMNKSRAFIEPQDYIEKCVELRFVIHLRQFEGVHTSKERSRCTQESVWPNKAARQSDGFPT